MDAFPDSVTGNVILKKRNQLKLAQHDFAKRVGVSAGAIASWEAKGNKPIALHTVSRNKLMAIW